MKVKMHESSRRCRKCQGKVKEVNRMEENPRRKIKPWIKASPLRCLRGLDGGLRGLPVCDEDQAGGLGREKASI